MYLTKLTAGINYNIVKHFSDRIVINGNSPLSL